MFRAYKTRCVGRCRIIRFTRFDRSSSGPHLRFPSARVRQATETRRRLRHQRAKMAFKLFVSTSFALGFVKTKKKTCFFLLFFSNGHCRRALSYFSYVTLNSSSVDFKLCSAAAAAVLVVAVSAAEKDASKAVENERVKKAAVIPPPGTYRRIAITSRRS